MLFTILNLPDIKGTALFCGLERVPIFWFPSSTPLLLTSARLYAHPTPENKRKAVEVLAAVLGGENKYSHFNIRKLAGINSIIKFDFKIELY